MAVSDSLTVWQSDKQIQQQKCHYIRNHSLAHFYLRTNSLPSGASLSQQNKYLESNIDGQFFVMKKKVSSVVPTQEDKDMYVVNWRGETISSKNGLM